MQRRPHTPHGTPSAPAAPRLGGPAVRRRCALPVTRYRSSGLNTASRWSSSLRRLPTAPMGEANLRTSHTASPPPPPPLLAPRRADRTRTHVGPSSPLPHAPRHPHLARARTAGVRLRVWSPDRVSNVWLSRENRTDVIGRPGSCPAVSCATHDTPPPPRGHPPRPTRTLLLPGGTGAQPLARGPHHRRSLMRAVGGPDLDGAIVDAYGARSARRPAVGARQGDDESWPLHKTNATKPYRRPPAFRHAKTRPSACSCAGPAASTWRRARSFAFERCQHPID